MADNNQKQAEMNITTFSLSRKSIENAFSKRKSRPKIPAEYKVALETVTNANTKRAKLSECENTFW